MSRTNNLIWNEQMYMQGSFVGRDTKGDWNGGQKSNTIQSLKMPTYWSPGLPHLGHFSDYILGSSCAVMEW